MSGGKSTTKQNNTLDPYSRTRIDQSRNRIMGLLDGGSATGGQASNPYQQYWNNNPDVSGYYAQNPGAFAEFGNDPVAAAQHHYQTHGQREGRRLGGGGSGVYTGGGRDVTGIPGADPAGGIASEGIAAHGGYQGDYGATGLSESERRAQGLINDYIGSYEGGMDEARGLIRDTNFTPGTLTPQTFADFDAGVYVNPYADDIISRTTGDIEEAAARTRTATTANNLAQRAYGGSRHGVADALTNEAMLDSIGDMAASTRFNVWNQGADRFYQDVGNDMTAQMYNNDQVNQGAAFDLQRAGLMADMVGAERGFQDQDINRLMGLGATERQIEDSLAARRYDNYWRRLQAEMGLMGGVPVITDGEGTQSYRPGLLDYANVGGNIASLFMGGGA